MLLLPYHLLTIPSQMEDGGSSSGSVGGVTAGLEAAITEKQETEAKLAQAELRIAQLEEHINSGGGAPPSGLMSPRYSKLVAHGLNKCDTVKRDTLLSV